MPRINHWMAVLALCAIAVIFIGPLGLTHAAPDDPPGLGTQPSVAPGEPAQPFDCSQLDWGLYWYGTSAIETHAGRDWRYMGGTSRKAYSDGRAITGYYDPQKPTVIFVHGWQRAFIENGYKDPTNPTRVFAARHEFDWRSVDPVLANDPQWQTADPTQAFNVAASWLAAGWNVGIFHWTQLADDDEIAQSGGSPINAETKIWTATAPDVGMRWRKCNADGTMSYETRADAMPTKPVRELFADAYKAAFAQYSGPEIRLVGHSLGAQLSVATTKLLYDDPTVVPNRKPSRIALVDPYWTSPLLSGVYRPEGVAPGELTRTYVSALKQAGVVFERTTTSDVNEFTLGDTNLPLDGLISNTTYDIGFLSQSDPISDLLDNHTAGFKLYFWSHAFTAPAECAAHATTFCAVTGRRAQAASTTHARTADIMNAGSVWEQVTGKDTATPADDTFKCTNACTQEVLLASGVFGAKEATIQAWLPTDQFHVTWIASEPTAEELAQTAILVLSNPATAAHVADVQAFIQRGGSVLLIGEHGKWSSFTDAARTYATELALPFGTANLLPDCDATAHGAAVKSPMLGLPLETPVLLAGANTVSFGIPLVQTSAGQTVVAGRIYEPSQSRIAVAGDSNIWGGCANYASTNRVFSTGLFNWLSWRQ